MLLTIVERLALLNILPKEGNFATLKSIREMREKVSFTDEERELIGFKHTVIEDGPNKGMVTFEWEPDKNEITTDLAFTKFETDTTVNSLVQLDSQGKLTEKEYSLYEKFVEGV